MYQFKQQTQVLFPNADYLEITVSLKVREIHMWSVNSEWSE